MRLRSFLALTSLLLAAPALPLLADDPPAGIAAGAELFDEGDFEGAAAFFDGADDSLRPWADYYLGRIEFEKENWDGAIESLTAAVEASSESSLFHRWLGHAYVEKINTVGMFAKMGVAKSAREHFEEAVRLAPGDLEARDAWVGYLTNAPAVAGGSREKAEEQVAQLTALSPSKGAVLRARMHFNEGEWPEAEAAYAKAIAADSSEAEYHYNLGFARQQQENYSGATEAFEAALEVDADYTPALYQIGRTAAFSGENTERAVEALKAYLDRPARRSEPAHEHAHWRLGMVYEAIGDTALAADSYRAALAIDPEHEQAKKALKKLE